MTSRPQDVARIGAGMFVLLAAWVTSRYALVERPDALVLLLAVALWIVLFTLAAVGCGAPIWRRISGETMEHPDALPLAAALGAAVMTGWAGALGAAGLLTPLTLLVPFALAAIVGAVAVRPVAAGLRFDGFPAIPAALLGAVGVVTLLSVATPSPFFDQVHYHLAFPERWLRSGSIDVFPRHTYSYLPANMGLLYTYALAGPGVWAAQALHWWMGALGALTAFRVARTAGGSLSAGAWAAAVFAVTPSVMLSATWAAADLGVAAFGAAALLMALRGQTRTEPSRRASWYLAGGALCGVAFGCKYLALATVCVPVGLLVATAALWNGGVTEGRARSAILRLLPWAAGVALAAGPWAIRNIWLTGDPVYPFYAETFARLLGRDLGPLAAEAQRIAPPETASPFRAMLDLRTFSPMGAAGAIGPLWLMLLPVWLGIVAFGRRSRRTITLALAVLAGIAAWSQFRQLGRYLLPVLVPAAAGAGLAIERMLSGVSGKLRPALVALLTFVSFWSLQGGFGELTFDRIACTLSRADTRELLTRYVSYWPALEAVNERLPDDARILLVGESRSLHIDREVVLEDPFGTPYLLELAQRSASPQAMRAALGAQGVTHVLYNEHEAARIARMGQRVSYFAGAPPADQARLISFLNSCLKLLEEAGPVRVYQLAETCGSLSAGALAP